VRRILWFDPDTDDPSTPIDWPAAALILATLFMNFSFWMLCGIVLRCHIRWLSIRYLSPAERF
jgi:hypothetical protein